MRFERPLMGTDYLVGRDGVSVGTVQGKLLLTREFLAKHGISTQAVGAGAEEFE
jgi:hypothetical protein